MHACSPATAPRRRLHQIGLPWPGWSGPLVREGRSIDEQGRCKVPATEADAAGRAPARGASSLRQPPAPAEPAQSGGRAWWGGEYRKAPSDCIG